MATKLQIIDEVLQYEDVPEISRKQAATIIDHFFEEIALALQDGQTVTIPRMVKFGLQYRPARTVMSNIEFGNPEAGQEKKKLPTKVTIKANVLKGLQESAPHPSSAAGKKLAAAYRERAEAREARQVAQNGSGAAEPKKTGRKLSPVAAARKKAPVK